MDMERRKRTQEVYRRRHREELRKKAKDYRDSEKGREKRRIYQKEYRKKHNGRLKEYDRRRYLKKKNSRKVEEDRASFTDANQSSEEETRILPNEIEQSHNLRQVENMYEGRESLSEASKRLYDEIEELYNSMNRR